MKSTRPEIHIGLATDVFQDHYWLKEELVAFCQAQKISAAGSKAELTTRVAALLIGAPLPPRSKVRAQGQMPSAFTRDMVVEAGWRCSQDLRAFFSAELRSPFRFDRFMREQISGAGAGRTLGDLLEAWKADVAVDAQTEIEPQFEYNRFVRAYRALLPSVTHEDVVKAWRDFRSMPASERPTVEDLVAQRPSK